MNSENYLMSSEISREEGGDEHEKEDSTAGTKRSHKCTFCKREFRNGQALGGHMTTHTKVRAKAKLINMPSGEGGDEHEKEDSTAGTKRSHECSFCKMGFPNGQALGGHMTIHRKERAKAMPNSSVLPNKFTNDESMTFPFDMCFHQQPSAPNPIIRNQLPAAAAAPVAHAFPYEFHNSSSSWPNLHLNQELRGPNLSLQIGPSDQRETQKENEVDLELRLGHP